MLISIISVINIIMIFFAIMSIINKNSSKVYYGLLAHSIVFIIIAIWLYIDYLNIGNQISISDVIYEKNYNILKTAIFFLLLGIIDFVTFITLKIRKKK